MAPQPDNDNTPKAPDKNDKTKGDKHVNADINREKNKDFKASLLVHYLDFLCEIVYFYILNSLFR